MKVHMFSHWVLSEMVTFCGIAGYTDTSSEFTVTGKENRLEYTREEKHATCERCRKSLRKAKKT